MYKLFVGGLSFAIVCLGLARDLVGADGEEKFNPEARVKAVAPFVDDETILVGHVDLTKEGVVKMLDEVAVVMSSDPAETNKNRKMFRDWIARFTKGGGKDLYIVYSLRDFPNELASLVIPVAEDSDGKDLFGLFGPNYPAKKIKGAVVYATPNTFKRLENFKPQARDELTKGFAAAGDTVAQVVVIPSADTRRVIEESLPTLPKELGEVPSKVMTRGVMWAAAGANGPPNRRLHLVIQSQDAEAAAKFKEYLSKLFDSLGKQQDILKIFPNFAMLAGLLTPEISADRLTVQMDDKSLNELLTPTFKKVQEASSRTKTTNFLKQIGLAMHNYFDVYKFFPMAANYDKGGKPLLSWRVHILPFVEANELYKQFHLDEPWDSEHNKKLIPQMPAVYYSSPKLGHAGKTTFLGVAGEGAMFPGNKPLAIKDITDGTSNTIWVVDADDSRAVIWTKPEDYNYDPKNPMAGLGERYSGAFLVLMVDASVRMVSTKISATTIRSLYTRAGGEVIGPGF